MKKINYLILLVVVFIGISCEPTYVKEYSWAYPVAGDWTMRAYVNGVEIDPASSNWYNGPFEFKTFNSAVGKDSIWLDDYSNIVFDKATNKWVPVANEHGNGSGTSWTVKCKVKVDMASKTFANSATVINSVGDYRIGIKVKNGKIVGNDSIRFEIQFEDDDTPYGTTYTFAGHRTTSYEEYMQ